jgi:hypothetical protein
MQPIGGLGKEPRLRTVGHLAGHFFVSIDGHTVHNNGVGFSIGYEIAVNLIGL